MPNELERWANPSSALIPSREERLHRKAVGRLVNETRFVSLKVDAEAALTGRIMERAVDLDTYRKRLANGDPVLNAVLTRIEVTFVDKANRLQSHFRVGVSAVIGIVISAVAGLLIGTMTCGLVAKVWVRRHGCPDPEAHALSDADRKAISAEFASHATSVRRELSRYADALAEGDVQLRRLLGEVEAGARS